MLAPSIALFFLAILLFIYSGFIKSGSLDVISHYALVNEIMTHWYVSPDALYLSVMRFYPDLSHWLAAILGAVSGDGLWAMSLLSIAAVYYCYYAIGKILGDSLTAVAIFAGLFFLLAPTASQIGWEVVVNFFYPQIVASAAYFAALLWCVAKQPFPKQVAAVAIFLIPVMFFTQPIVGLHASAMLFGTVAVDMLPKRKAENFLYLGAIGLISLISLYPIRIILVIAANDGDLNFDFGMPLAVPVVACGAISLTNLIFPLCRKDMVLGAAGTLSALLMAFQWVLWEALGTGSFYAVKKHAFIVMALGLTNLTRLLSRRLPTFRSTFAAMLLAVFATITIYRQHDWGETSIGKVAEYRTFANRFIETPSFQPGNTKAFLLSETPTINRMISSVFFRGSIDEPYEGKNPVAPYLMVETRKNAPCAVLSDDKLTIVASPCVSPPGPR